MKRRSYSKNQDIQQINQVLENENSKAEVVIKRNPFFIICGIVVMFFAALFAAATVFFVVLLGLGELQFWSPQGSADATGIEIYAWWEIVCYLSLAAVAGFIVFALLVFAKYLFRPFPKVVKKVDPFDPTAGNAQIDKDIRVSSVNDEIQLK